jgi:hypothetical protein
MNDRLRHFSAAEAVIDAASRLAHLAITATTDPTIAADIGERLSFIVEIATTLERGPNYAGGWDLPALARIAVELGVTDVAVQLIAEAMPWLDALEAAEACGCPSPLAGDVSAPSPAESTITP